MNPAASTPPVSVYRRILGGARMLLLHVRRTLASNLQTIPVAEHEKRALMRAGIMDATLQRYVSWRRSVLLLVIPPTVLGAVLFTSRMIEQGFEYRSPLGATLRVIDALVLYFLPLAALLAARSWTRHHLSHRILFHGWVIAFLFPIGYALCPLGWQFKFSADLEEREMQRRMLEGAGIFLGIVYYLALMPTVMSLLPGLIRASVRLKSLVPAFMVPGWFLMAAAPLYVLLWLVVFVAVNHFAGNALLICGVLLWIGAPLLYVARSDTFLRPLDPTEGGRTIQRLQMMVNACLAVAAALLLIYAFTKRILGVPILGFDESTTLVWMVQNSKVEIGDDFQFSQPPTALVWIGDVHLYRYLFEYLGRSLYMTVVFADLLMQLEVMVWQQEKRFFQTESAAGYDQFMTDAEKVYQPGRPDGDSINSATGP